MPTPAQIEALNSLRANDWAKQQLAKEKDEEEFSLTEMIGNVPSDSWSVVKEIGHAANPINWPDVAGAIGNLGLGAVQKAIPGEQDSEKYADAFMNDIIDKYGSWDKFLNTLENEPVHTLMDISPLGAVGGKLLKAAGNKLPDSTASKIVSGAGDTLTDVSMAVDPVNFALKSPKFAAKALSHIVNPEDMWLSAAKVSTVLDKKKGRGSRQQIAKTALDEKIMPTNEGVDYLADQRLKEVGQMQDDIITAADQSGVRWPIDDVAAGLDDLKAKFSGFKMGGADSVKLIDKTWNKFKKDMQKQGINDVGVRELHEFKKDLHDQLSWDKRQLKPIPRGKDAALRALDRKSIEMLEEAVPELHGVNKLYGELRELQDPLMQSAGRIENLNRFGNIDIPLKISGGAALGGTLGGVPGAAIGGTIGGVAGVLDMPKVKARNAIAAHELRNTPLLSTLDQSGAVYSGRNIIQQIAEEYWDQKEEEKKQKR